MKDWTGNKNSIFKTLGASNHTDKERQREDFYATDPVAAELLCDVESFSHDVWEPACGMGHLSEVLKKRGYNVRSTDLIDRGYGDVHDFLGMDVTEWNGDIITNPPYKFALDFIYKALQIIPDGHKVAMFLKIQFLEGKERRQLFNSCPPPLRVCLIITDTMCKKRRLSANERRGRKRCRLCLVCLGERIPWRYNHKVD